MITWYRGHLGSIAHAMRIYRHWLHRRPLVAGAISTAVLVIGLQLLAAAPAYALGAADAVELVTLTDSQGVPVDAFQTLPIGDGGLLGGIDPGINRFLTGLVWTSSFVVFKILLTLTAFMLEFQWVEWLATPFVGAVEGLRMAIGLEAWVGAALAVTAFVAGAVILSGRLASGATEIFLAALAAALAAGVLANPTLFLTGPNGAILTVTGWGREIANIVATGQVGGQYALGPALLQPMVDLMFRMPYQAIAFGHDLTGDCSSVLTAALQSDQAADDTYIRGQVGSCDAAAGEHADTANAMHFAMALLTLTSRFFVFLPTAIGIVLLVVTVAFTLFDSARLIVGLMIATLPFNKRMAWRAGVGMIFGLIGLLALLVMMAGYNKFVTDVAAVTYGFLGYLMGQGLIVTVCFALVVILLLVLWNIRRKGRALADRLEKLGASMPRSGPLPIGSVADATRRAIRTAADVADLARSGKPTPSPVERPAAAIPAAAIPAAAGGARGTATPGSRGQSARPPQRGLPDRGPLEATFSPVDDSTPSPSSPKGQPQLPGPVDGASTLPRRAQHAKSAGRAALNVGAIALAASTGGTSAAVTEGVRIVGQAALSKATAPKAPPVSARIDAASGQVSITSLPDRRHAQLALETTRAAERRVARTAASEQLRQRLLAQRDIARRDAA